MRSTPNDEGMWLRETMVGEEILWWGNSYQSYQAVWRGDWRQDLMNSVAQASKVEGWFTSQDTVQSTSKKENIFKTKHVASKGYIRTNF